MSKQRPVPQFEELEDFVKRLCQINRDGCELIAHLPPQLAFAAVIATEMLYEQCSIQASCAALETADDFEASHGITPPFINERCTNEENAMQEFTKKRPWTRSAKEYYEAKMHEPYQRIVDTLELPGINEVE